MLYAGSNFGPGLAAVKIGTLSTTVVNASHSSITCEVPPGVGTGVIVNVSVGGQYSLSTLHYDPPIITSVTPNLVNAVLGGQIVIKGVNFGPSISSLSVELVTWQVSNGTGNGTQPEMAQISSPCTDLLWISDSQTRCTITGGEIVAVANVTVSVANQSAVAEVDIMCPPGYYGSLHETCTQCPTGATCAGLLADPRSLPGFWREERGMFVACKPEYACTGGAQRHSDMQCGPGYAGKTCSICAPRHFRLRQDCPPCPDLAWLFFVGFGVGLLSIVGFAYFLNKRRVNLAGLSIGVDFMQIIAMVRSRVLSNSKYCPFRSLPALTLRGLIQ